MDISAVGGFGNQPGELRELRELREMEEMEDDSSFKSLDPLREIKNRPGETFLERLNGAQQNLKFVDFVKDSIVEVNKLQEMANVQAKKVATGETQNIHEVMTALEKADIAFRLMSQVRSKMIDAYKEVMRIQV